MAKHTLMLDIPDTRNTCVMPISDASVYANKVSITCPYLDILSPGFNEAVRIVQTPGFGTVNFTACDLGLQKTACGVDLYDIPDGVYAIKWSVSPNDYVFVEYNHLRITHALNKFNKVLCQIEASPCEPTVDIANKLKEMSEIEMFLKAAKAKVEYCHNPKKGMDLYTFAMKKLNKISCNIC